MRHNFQAILLFGLVGMLIGSCAPGLADDANLRIDVPVVLKEAKVLFNMDHLSFAGDTPIGLNQMTKMLKQFKSWQTDYKMIAVFSGQAGYTLLKDDTYNQQRRTRTGNPYKTIISDLAAQGVEFEECANTMVANHWTNSDLLPEAKVDTGSIFRIVELTHKDYVVLQP